MPSLLSPVAWRDEKVSRLILGTAQLGLDYGIANDSGKPDAARAQAIVSAAWECGIRHFDTAQAYGDSESVLGRALHEVGVADQACIATKIPFRGDPFSIEVIEESLETSLMRLGVRRLWCVMLHHPRGLAFWDEGLGEVLLRYQEAGRITHLGASLSSLDDAEACIAQKDLAVLQVPASAWDQRPIHRGTLDAAASAGKLCCVRSLYLQGLLAMTPEAVAQRMPIAEKASRIWHAFAAECGMSPVAMAIRFGMGLNLPLVVGADTPSQVEETVTMSAEGGLEEAVCAEMRSRLQPLLEDRILEPWRW